MKVAIFLLFLVAMPFAAYAGDDNSGTSNQAEPGTTYSGSTR